MECAAMSIGQVVGFVFSIGLIFLGWFLKANPDRVANVVSFGTWSQVGFVPKFIKFAGWLYFVFGIFGTIFYPFSFLSTLVSSK
jgi:hypothetical protein